MVRALLRRAGPPVLPPDSRGHALEDKRPPARLTLNPGQTCGRFRYRPSTTYATAGATMNVVTAAPMIATRTNVSTALDVSVISFPPFIRSDYNDVILVSRSGYASIPTFASPGSTGLLAHAEACREAVHVRNRFPDCLGPVRFQNMSGTATKRRTG